MKTLAISVGTRASGVAIIDGTELIVSEMLYINRSTHSYTKRIRHYVMQYDITAAVIKTPPDTHITGTLAGIIEKMSATCSASLCGVHYTTDKEIKALSSRLVNKHTLMEVATSLFPDLHRERQRESAIKNRYYVRIFEAAVAAYQYQQANS